MKKYILNTYYLKNEEPYTFIFYAENCSFAKKIGAVRNKNIYQIDGRCESEVMADLTRLGIEWECWYQFSLTSLLFPAGTAGGGAFNRTIVGLQAETPLANNFIKERLK